MSRPDESSDELQRIWQEDRGNAAEQETSMIVQLVREKHRSFQDLVRAESSTAYVLSLSFAPLTGLAAWKAHPWLPFGLGYLIMTAALVAAAIAVWLNQRAIARPIDLSVRQYHQQLLRLYEKRIRFFASSQYWYLALFFGCEVVLYPLAVHFLPKVWSIVLLGVLLVLCAIAFQRSESAQEARLRQRQDELRSLLEEMDRP